LPSRYRIILLTLILLASPTSHAQTQCTNNGLLRSVKVVYPEQGQVLPCEVRYEKPAENQSMTLWRAENQAGYCETQAENFVAKLQDLGWSCTAATNSNPIDGEQ